jgi:hypothetical protein
VGFHLAWSHGGVGGGGFAFEVCGLDFQGGDDVLAVGGGEFALVEGGEFAVFNKGNFDMEVDAI